MLLSPKACENLINIEKIDERIMVAEFNSNPKLTFIACYSPTNSSDEEEVLKFYQSLKSVVENVPAHNFLTIAGDFNAKLGPEDALFTFDDKTNRNGEMLLDLIDEFNLFSSNNNFMKNKSKLWSFTYPNGCRAQLDYILFRKKWRNSVHDAQAFSSFSNVGSDHRIVSSKVTLSLRAPKKVPTDPMKRVDWNAVTSNKELSSQYAIDVFNRFSELSCADDTAETKYSNLIAVNAEIALSSLPKKSQRNPVKFNTHHQVISAREKLQTISQQHDLIPSSQLKSEITQCKRDLEEAYTLAQAEYIEGKITELKYLHVNKQHSAAWAVVNEITGRKEKPSPIIKGGSQEARTNNWVDHFKGLLGEPSPVEDILRNVEISPPLNISVEPFSLMDIELVVNSLKTKSLQDWTICPV